jgi:hypothetical protein
VWSAGFDRVEQLGTFDMKVKDEFTVPHVCCTGSSELIARRADDARGRADRRSSNSGISRARELLAPIMQQRPMSEPRSTADALADPRALAHSAPGSTRAGCA